MLYISAKNRLKEDEKYSAMVVKKDDSEYLKNFGKIRDRLLYTGLPKSLLEPMRERHIDDYGVIFPSSHLIPYGDEYVMSLGLRSFIWNI